MSFLSDKLKQYDWREIAEEWYGKVNEDIVEEEPTQYPEPIYKGKNFPVEVEGEFYSNTKEASEKLNINYHTLRDWISGRRTPKLKCKKLPS